MPSLVGSEMCIRDRPSFHLVHEARLPNVGKSREQQRAGVGVEGGQTREMPPNLLEVGQGCLLPLQEGAHAPQGRPLELLAAVERVTCGFRFLPGTYTCSHGSVDVCGRYHRGFTACSVALPRAVYREWARE